MYDHILSEGYNYEENAHTQTHTRKKIIQKKIVSKLNSLIKLNYGNCKKKKSRKL